MTQTPEEVWLTQEAYDRLQAEFDERQTTRRGEITKRIEAAREEGDLRENGGYHAAKDEQGKNEARIRQLRQLLDTAKIGAPPSGADEVAQGAVVTVDFVGRTRTLTFMLASREEAAHAEVEVYSPSSPLGAAVMKHKVGDTVTYATPTGKDISVKITKVEKTH